MLSERNGGSAAVAQAEAFRYMPAEGAEGPSESPTAPAAWPSSGQENGRDGTKEREAFERGVREGENRAKSALETQLNAARGAIAAAIEQFKSERESYFNRVEPEAVQLALAIAQKILHREAQIDPLLLTGMVRVALEKMESGTLVRLRTHPDDIRTWSDYFDRQSDSIEKPELAGDNNLQRGECALETEFGSTRMSLELQLKEIEQGFLDLLEQRPQVR